MQDGKMVGIVSRTDLLGVVEHLPKLTATKKAGVNQLYGLLRSLFGGRHADSLGDLAAASAPGRGVAPPHKI